MTMSPLHSTLSMVHEQAASTGASDQIVRWMPSQMQQLGLQVTGYLIF